MSDLKIQRGFCAMDHQIAWYYGGQQNATNNITIKKCTFIILIKLCKQKNPQS